MQVAVGGVDGDFLGAEAAQAGGDGGCRRIPHVGVADHGDVGAQFFCRLVQKAGQICTAGFLFAFQKDGHRHRQLARDGFPGPARLDKGHQLALVIGRAPRVQFARAIGKRDEGGIERVRGPQFQRVDRLDVVVTIEQDRGAGAFAVMAQHDRMAPGVADRGIKADRLEVGHMPFGAGAGFSSEGRVGGDGFQPDCLEQAVQHVVKIGVDMGKDFVED